MKRNHLVLPLGLALLVGCVSRSEMEAVKLQYETCERDKVAAQQASQDCQTRCDTEAQRWTNIETQLTSTLPQTLRDFQDERSKIIQLVPEEVKKQVGARLDRYFVNVSKQFERMEGKVEGLREELASSRGQIAELASTTRSVDSKVDATHRAVLTERASRDEATKKASDIVNEIVSFDRDRINCEKCKDRIKLKGKQREALLAFHAELIQKIQRLQAQGAAN